MSIEALDYVAQGIARLPEKGRLDKTVRFISVYLSAVQDNEDSVITLLNAWLDWRRQGKSYSFILDLIGESALGQVRPATFGDVDYLALLVARTVVHTSSATASDVERVVAYLASINGGTGQYLIAGSAPEHWDIAIYGVELSAQWELLYFRLLRDTIGAVDSFDFAIIASNACLYDLLPGFDEGDYS